MSFIDWSQILIFIIIIILISSVVGKYIAIVLEGKPTLMSLFLSWLEVFCYRTLKLFPQKRCLGRSI